MRSGASISVQPAGLILASILPLTAVNGMGFAFKATTRCGRRWTATSANTCARRSPPRSAWCRWSSIWDLGFRQITNSVKPIKSAADLAGMKLRVPGAPALVSLFNALGTHPVSMQFGEVYTSLQTKVVDGQENPLSIIDAGKFYEVQKFCSMTNHVWDGHWICVNKAAWNRLPDDIKTDRRAPSTTARLRSATSCNKLEPHAAGRPGKEGHDASPSPDTTASATSCATAGFYKEWREKLGAEAWGLLEKQVGKLG